MAYNNGFPMSYPQYYPQNNNLTPNFVSFPANNAPNQQNSIIWVQGEAGAKSYLVAPNTTVSLWDSETQTIYMKSADMSGMPSMKILDYTIREANQPTVPVIQNTDEYVTREEFAAFEEKIKKQLDRGNRKETKNNE
jgi:2-phosphoglycerate kinase